ncbi:hypothetical protein [Azohydromonas australica]|uniref:hypothetical protein n=1 Tax=Azohydromonas australica TaxID=364039 RepID=UPI0012EC5BCE|nr:hypothetical protein [Azohydromonas australica]
MHMTLKDAVRARVDEMRSTHTAPALDTQHVVTALVASLPVDAPRAADKNQSSHGGAAHMCPWHTCAATRHG